MVAWKIPWRASTVTRVDIGVSHHTVETVAETQRAAVNGLPRILVAGANVCADGPQETGWRAASTRSRVAWPAPRRSSTYAIQVAHNLRLRGTISPGLDTHKETT